MIRFGCLKKKKGSALVFLLNLVGFFFPFNFAIADERLGFLEARVWSGPISGNFS